MASMRHEALLLLLSAMAHGGKTMAHLIARAALAAAALAPWLRVEAANNAPRKRAAAHSARPPPPGSSKSSRKKAARSFLPESPAFL